MAKALHKSDLILLAFLCLFYFYFSLLFWIDIFNVNITLMAKGRNSKA